MPRPRSLPFAFELALALLEALEIRERQRLVEDFCEFAAVEHRADSGLVGHGGGGNEIALSQRHGIDARNARGFLDQPLDRVIGFRPPGAAIRPGRQRVGVDALHGDIEFGNVVHRRKAAREIVGRKLNAGECYIGAEILHLARTQCEKLALLVERKFGDRDIVARLVVGVERFRAARHPMHFAAKLLGSREQNRIFRIGAGLQPEGATDILGDDMQRLLLDPHDGCEQVSHGAGALRADAQAYSGRFSHRSPPCRRAFPSAPSQGAAAPALRAQHTRPTG